MKIFKIIKRKSNINFSLQNELRKEVIIEDSFDFEGKKYYYKIDSNDGLIFYDEGINKYHFSGFIKNSREKKIFYQYWLLDPFKETVFFIHGNAENSSSHPFFIFYLLKKGFNVLTFDQEGYGSSDGIRGTIIDLNYYFENIDLIYKFYYNKILFLKKGAINLVKDDDLKNPEFIFIGFSMGGFEVLYYVYIYLFSQNNIKYINNKKIKITKDKEKYNKKENFRYISSIKKIILLCPWLYTHKRLTSPIILKIISFFYKYFNPYKILSQDLQNQILQKDENFYIELYKNLTDNYEYLKRRFKDTRIHRLRSIRWLAYITKYQNNLYNYIKKLSKKLKNYFENDKNLNESNNIKNELVIYRYLFQNTFFFECEKDIIVDLERIRKLALIINKTVIQVNQSNNIQSNDKIDFLKSYNNLFLLKDYYHDFLDYDEVKIKDFLDKLDRILFYKI